MKRVTYLFWSVVGAIGLVFVLTVTQAISEKKSSAPAAPESIPVPAELPQTTATPQASK